MGLYTFNDVPDAYEELMKVRATIHVTNYWMLYLTTSLL